MPDRPVLADDSADWKPLQPPPVPPPSTPTELLRVCEEMRRGILRDMKAGLDACPAPADAGSFAAFCKRKTPAFLLPHVARLWDAMTALDLGDVPGRPAEPHHGHEAVAALDTVIVWCKGKAQVRSAKMGKRGLKEPSKDALAAYRMYVLLGDKQTNLAKKLSQELRKSIGQPTVSRWIKQVKQWLAAGNVLPDLSEAFKDKDRKPEVEFVDSADLDRGPRLDNRRPTGRRSDC